MKRIFHALILLILLSGGGGLIGALDTDYILYIDSYHHGYPWSDGIFSGLVSVFNEDGRYELAVEHLDAKRHDDPRSRQQFLKLLESRYLDHRPEAVIVSDDPAFSFILDYREEVASDIPVIFLGINRFEASQVRSIDNIYGIADSPDIENTLNLALQLHPDTRQIVIVHDQTATGLADRRRAEGYLSKNSAFEEYRISYITDLSREELSERAQTFDEPTVFIALHFVIDRTRHYLDPDTYISLLSESGHPVYIVNDLGLGSSPAVGGYIRSSYREGRLAGELALEAVQGTAVNRFLPSSKAFIFNFPSLERYGISEHQLPVGSQILNRPPPINPGVLNTLYVLAVLVAVLIIILTLLFRSKKQLGEQARMLQEIFDLFPQPVAGIYYDTGGPIFINEAMAELTETTKEKALQKKRLDISESLRELKAVEIPARLDRQAAEERQLVSERVSSQDSSARLHLVVQKIPFIWNNRQAVLTSLLDVTEETEAQEQLRQTEKLQVVGKLTGGIAHDFNNQVMAILGYAELLQLELTEERLKEYARFIIMAAESSRALTGKLLAFSRRQEADKKLMCLNELVSDAVELLKRSVDRRVAIDSILPDHRLWIYGEKVLIENALLNLGLNAVDAIEGEGAVILELYAASRLPEDQVVHSFLKKSGPYALISVRDSGSGIPDEVLESMFDPFFTTKSEGHGTGMGLAAVLRTARNHQAAVTIRSVVDKGTTVTLCFAMSGSEEAEAALLSDARRPEPVRDGKSGGGRRILVVDDERLVRFVITRTLEEAGYEVTAVESGIEAIERYAATPEAFELVLLDMIMPGKNGLETFRALREISADLQVVLISGYVDMEIVKQMKLDGLADFMEKPINREVLLQTVEDALERL